MGVKAATPYTLPPSPYHKAFTGMKACQVETAAFPCCFQETAAYRITALQKALDESVPSSDLDRSNKQYTELTVKYRDMLQRDNHMVQRTSSLEHLEVLTRSISKMFIFWSICFVFQSLLPGKCLKSNPPPPPPPPPQR